MCNVGPVLAPRQITRTKKIQAGLRKLAGSGGNKLGKYDHIFIYRIDWLPGLRGYRISSVGSNEPFTWCASDVLSFIILKVNAFI